MNPSGEDKGNEKKQSKSSENSSASASVRNEELARQQQYHAQHGVNVAAMPYNYALPRYVNHTYRDFSHYIKDGNRVEKHKKSDRNFPALLHSILSNEQYSHIISWMPHGRAWKIKNKDLLMKEVVPQFFGQSKYASFARQLSGWGFKRLHQTGPDFGCYYHECFLRGHPRLTPLMRRVTPGRGKETPNMNAEPDFYLIAKQYPLRESDEEPDDDDDVSLEKVAAPFSGRLETESEYPGGEDCGNLLSRKVGAPANMESMMLRGHKWDPFDRLLDSARPSVRDGASEATRNPYDGNSTNQLAKRSTPRDSFSSADEESGSSTQEARKYDPLPCKYQQLQPGLYRDRGYSDPFPRSDYPLLLDPNTGYTMPMHPSHQDYYGVNVNQYAYEYAGGSSHQHQASAAGYNYPPPQYPQFQQHEGGMDSHTSGYGSWYGNPYCSNNYHSAQGLHGYAGPDPDPRANTTPPPQAHHAAEGVSNQDLSLPLFKFSPLKTIDN